MLDPHPRSRRQLSGFPNVLLIDFDRSFEVGEEAEGVDADAVGLFQLLKEIVVEMDNRTPD